MYKYDKKKDQIFEVIETQNGKWESFSVGHSWLEAMREALGLKKHGERKYTVQILINDSQGFLNVDKAGNNDCFLSDSGYNPDYQAQFTQAEIDVLKQRNDLAFDWDKAIIKPVEDE